jgi:Trk K+ transport system NAD-binding subunit
MEAIIFGCGQLTTLLAPQLVEDGYRVTVLDADRECLELLEAQYPVKIIVTSEPLMQDYLHQAEVEISELFLAISDNDHQNLLFAQTALHLFNVPSVVCRLDSPLLQELYAEMGLNVVGTSLAPLAEKIQKAIVR